MAIQRRRNTQQPSGVPGRGYVPPAPQEPARQQPYQPNPYSAQMPPQTMYNPRPMKQSRRKNWPVWVVIAVLAVVIVVIGTSVRRMEEEKAAARQRAEEIHAKVTSADGVFCSGVYVDGIHLGGMTPQQAKDAVETQVQQRSGSWYARLTYGENWKLITADMINFTTDVNGVLQEAWNQGHTGDENQRYADMLRLEQTPYQAYTAQPSGDTRAIDEVLATVKNLIDTPAQDAYLAGVNKEDLSYPFVFADEVYGLVLDTEPLRQKLYQMVSTLESGDVEIIPDRIEPAVRKADLMKKYTLRATATTRIHSSSTENRNNNIRHAFSDFVNGYRLEPGQSFSFNKVVGMRTQERGFFPADEIVSGEMVEGYGGGVCQASTTIYQAALCAGLQIVTRQPHSEKVKYAELGQDATVYLSKNRNKDFVFKNTTDSDIWIFATVEKDPERKGKNNLRTRVDIYGEDMGDVWYKLESVITETVDPPEPEYRKDKKSQYVTYQDEKPYLYSEAQPGYKVDVYLVDSRSGSKSYLYTDEYSPKRAVYYQGVKTR